MFLDESKTMTVKELKEEIVAKLKSFKYGASTRIICNALSLVKGKTFIVRPGAEKMRQVYGYLKTLEKQGLVKREYPGHWIYNNSEQITP